MPPEESAAAAVESAPSDGGGIKSAADVIEKVLAQAEPSTKPGTPESKKDPARRVEKLEAKAVEKAAESPAPPDDAAQLEKARFHLKHGDVAKFIELAAGTLDSKEMADGVREALARKLGVGSAQWEKIRQYEKGAKREVARREQELSGLVEQLKSEYAPFHEARNLYKAGDYDAAFKAAFGEDAADYQRKIISQRVGKNPEIEALKAQLEERDRKQAEREQGAADARAEQEQQQAQLGYMREMQSTLLASDDPELAAYAAQPAFIRRVFGVLQENYQRDGVELPLEKVVQYVRDYQVSVAEARQWAPAVESSGAVPAKAVQASALPVKPPVAKAPARALTQSRAAEATGKPVKETAAQVRERYQRLMEQSAD